VGRSVLHVDRSSATVHASTAVSLVSRTIWLVHEVRGRPAGRTPPAVMWSVSGPGILDELQRLCGVRLATDVAKDGMTTGGYGAEYARKIRHVGHGFVGDKSFHLIILMPRIRL